MAEACEQTKRDVPYQVPFSWRKQEKLGRKTHPTPGVRIDGWGPGDQPLEQLHILLPSDGQAPEAGSLEARV